MRGLKMRPKILFLSFCLILLILLSLVGCSNKEAERKKIEKIAESYARKSLAEFSMEFGGIVAYTKDTEKKYRVGVEAINVRRHETLFLVVEIFDDGNAFLEWDDNAKKFIAAVMLSRQKEY